MTFFQGLVIESDGARTHTLDLDATALTPIADAARVYALAAGNLRAKSTLQRRQGAAQTLPDRAEVFSEAAAAAAFRVVSGHAERAARRPLGVAVVSPGDLTKIEQRVLKTSFHAIAQLLELTATPARWAAPHAPIAP